METNPRTNIVLTGFMGVGKTTAGRLVAGRLGRAFVDMDRVIEARQGRSIAAIFAESGEPYFRNLERELVRELADGANQVVATGGGVVLNPDNIRDFERTGVVICLTAEPRAILERVAAEQHRPLLEGGAKEQKILELLARRRALYEAVPRRIDTTGLAPEAVADRIMAIVREAGLAPRV